MTPAPVGLIGLDAAGIALAEAVRLHPELTLAVVADAKRPRGETAADRLDAGFAPDYLDVLNDITLDGLIVAGDLADRSTILAEAAARGRTVLTVAPPATTLARLDDLILSAARGGARVACVNPLRAMIPCQQAMRALRDGAAGQRLAVFASHRTTNELSDPLVELGVPLLDFLIESLGEPVTHIQATAAPLLGRTDAWVLILGFRSGLIATVEVGHLLPASFPMTDDIRVEFAGTDQVIVVEPSNQALTTFGSGGVRRDDWSPDLYRAMVDDFAAILRDGAEPEQSLVALRWVMPLIEAARQSAERDEPVTVG